MNKYSWTGGINDDVLMEVVACRGGDGTAYLKVEGVIMALLHSHKINSGRM